MAEKALEDQSPAGEKVERVHQEALHKSELSDEELAIEKELRLKIDIRIMPLVILVYLMNYIDRYVYTLHRQAMR